MKRYFSNFFILCGLFSSLANAIDLEGINQQVIKEDLRNQGIDFSLSSEEEVLRFCLEGVGEFSSQSDVFRVFLQTAAALKSQRFQDVALCYQNKVQFLLSGEDFLVLGQEYGVQNLAYTVRMFPEKLRLNDGSAAFEVHRGGLLYVMNKQMIDYRNMHLDWYWRDVVARKNALIDAKRPTVFAEDNDVF